MPDLLRTIRKHIEAHPPMCFFGLLRFGKSGLVVAKLGKLRQFDVIFDRFIDAIFCRTRHLEPLSDRVRACLQFFLSWPQWQGFCGWVHCLRARSSSWMSRYSLAIFGLTRTPYLSGRAFAFVATLGSRYSAIFSAAFLRASASVTASWTTPNKASSVRGVHSRGHRNRCLASYCPLLLLTGQSEVPAPA